LQRRPGPPLHPRHPLPADPGHALCADPSLPGHAVVRPTPPRLLRRASARADRRSQGGWRRRVAHLLPDRGPAVATRAGDRGPLFRAGLLERLVSGAALHQQSIPGTAPELAGFGVRGEPTTCAEASRGPFAPIRIGDAWGPPWSTTWFHVTGHVTNDRVGQRVVALFDLGFDGPTGFTCEAQAWKDGKPWRGVDPNHRWLPIDGPEVDFYLEAAANPRATEQ